MDKRGPSLPAPLFLPSLAFITGILLADKFPSYHYIVVFISVLLSIASLLCHVIPQLKMFKLMRVLLLLLLIGNLGYLRSQTLASFPANHLSSLLDERDPIQNTFTGIIMTEGRKTSNGFQYTLKLKKLMKYPITGNIILFTLKDTLSYKDRIQALLRIQFLEPMSNPAMFDYREYLLNRKIYGTGIPLSKINKIGTDSFSLNDVLLKTRIILFRQIDNRFTEQAPFVKALLFGERIDLKEQTQVLTRGGLLHLIAISGMNILLIYGILFTILNLFLPRLPVRIVLLFVMIFYAGLCSWTPSVIRAVVMIDLFLIAGIFERRIGGLQLIGASLLIIGVIDPTQILSIGLQLSYACIVVLMLVFPKLSFSLRYAKENLASWNKSLFKVTDVMIISILISLYLIPLTLFYFHQFGMNGIIGNVIGIPLIAALMPLAMLILILSTPLWIPFHNSYTLLYDWFSHWADYSGQLPFFWNYLYFPTWQFTLGISVLILSIFLFQPMLKRKKQIFCVFLIFLILPIILFRHPVLSNPRIICFDVGIGDCTLIQTTTCNVLIDTGPISGLKPQIAYSVLPYLQNRGIHHLKYLFLSHPHLDHTGGVSYLAQDLIIDSVIVNRHFLEDPEGKNVIRLLASKKNCHVRILADTLSFCIDDFRIHILHPDRNYENENLNNEAMVMSIEHGKFKGLFTGDVEEDAEAYITEDEFLSKQGFTFMKVPHHGSKTSGNRDFLSKIHPKIAVINASLHNRFHFPNQKTVDTYHRMGSKVFVTGENGAIQMDIHDDYLEIKTWKDRKEFQMKL